MLNILGDMAKWLTRRSAKPLDLGSNPSVASNPPEIVPDPIPKMTQGLVVPPFDINITHCGYCHRRLRWKQGDMGWTYGCPMYGDKSDYTKYGERQLLLSTGEPWKYGGDVGWHYHWWEDYLQRMFQEAMKDLTNAEA